MSATVELLRAPIFHTFANPFHDDRGLVSHEDGALLVRDGRIAASGDYQTVRAECGDVPTTDWRGGVLLPGLVDVHVHFPQVRILGGIGLTLLDWLDELALPEEARMAETIGTMKGVFGRCAMRRRRPRPRRPCPSADGPDARRGSSCRAKARVKRARVTGPRWAHRS